MPRMKLTNEEFNEKELNVKVEPSKFKRYTGDIPRTGTVLIHRVTKAWWTQSEDGTSMIKLLAVAERNTGDKKQYNGLPTWEYLVFKPEAAFRYVPWLECFGITLKDIKSKMVVADEPDNIGDIIESLGSWEVGSDDALCRIVIFRRKWDGEWQSRVDRDGWLTLEDDDDIEDEPDEDEEDEEDEPPARPTRGRSTSRSAGTRVSSRRRAEPEPDEDEDEDEDEDIDEDEDVDDEDEDELDDAEEEEQEEEAEEEEQQTSTRRGRTQSRRAPARTTSSSRAAKSSDARPASSRRTDGSRTRSSSARRSTASTERTVGPRGSKGRDGGSREDPPF